MIQSYDEMEDFLNRPIQEYQAGTSGMKNNCNCTNNDQWNLNLVLIQILILINHINIILELVFIYLSNYLFR